MGLDTTTLKASIITAMKKAENNSKVAGATPDEIQQAYAEDLTNAITSFVKSGQVNPGISVQVATDSGSGATNGIGSIS